MNFRILAALLLTTWELGFRASAQGVFVPTDLLGSAPMISTPGWQIRGPIGTNSAGAEAGEPAHAGSPALASQWVQLRFPESGFISLTVGNQEGIRIAVYTGPSVSNLAEVTSAAVTPRRNSFGWEVQAGVTYSLAVDLISGARPQTSTEIYGAFLREFLRPQVSPLPDQAPATVTLDPVLLDPGEEINRVSYSLGDGRTIRRSQPPWSVTVTNLYGGTSTVSAQVASNRRAGLLLPLFQISLRSPNDHWHQAGIVPGDSVDWSSSGNVELATAEAGEPPFAAGGSAVGSIWWRWTPAFNAWTRVDFAGSGSTLQLYSGTQLEELIEWPLPTGGTFYAEAGRPYAIRLSRTPNQRSFGTTVGLHRTTLRLQPPESVLVETNAGGGFDVRVTSGQSHQFTTQEFNPLDTLPTVQLERLTEAGWIVLDSVEALPRRFAITAPDGSVETYRVSGTNQTGAFRSSDPVRVIAAPAHDRFEHAIVLPAEGLPDWSWAGVSVAGRESGEPPLGPVAHSGSLWFRWTPSGHGTGSVRIPQTAGPTIIAVFTGDSLESLQPVAARMVADAGQTLEFPFQVSAGVAYYIALGGVEPSGPVSLELIPIHVVPVPHELTVGVPTPLSATRFEGSGPEVLWMLGSEPLLSLTPDPSASASWTPTNTGPFTLRASANFGAGPVLLFEVSGFVRPANDSKAAATLLTEYQGLPGFIEIKGDLTAATREPGDPSALDGAGGTVWYEWTVPVGNLRARQTSGLPGLRMDLFAVGEGGLLTQVQSLTGLDQVQSLKVDPGVHVLMAISSPFPEAAAFKVFLGPAPANDDFQNATVLTASSSGATIPLSTANILATTEDAEINLPALEPFRRYGNLWWKFTGPEFGGALFHLLDSQVPNTAAVFTGTCLTNLQLLVGPEAAGDNPVAWVPFQVEPGVSYWIAAGGNPRRDEVFGPVAGAFEFVAAPDLSNDRFSNRLPLSGAEVTVTRSNRSASVEAGEPTGQAQTLWWEWTSPGDGAVRVRVNPLEWGGDSRAFLFTGDTLSGLQSASVTDEVYVSGGQRIAIAVGVSGDGDPGLFELSVRWRTVTPPSSNTRWGEPETLSLNSDVLTGNLHGAVTEEGIFPTGPGGSLWWQFTAPHTGLLELESLSSDSFSPLGSLYIGDRPESFQQIAYEWGGPRLGWKVVAGVTYRLRISAELGTPGEFQMRLRFWYPANDAFAQAILVQGDHPELEAWITDATVETGEPMPTGDLAQSLWWRWVAPSSGRLEQPWVAELVPRASVYRGTSLSNLALVPPIATTPDQGMTWAVEVAAGETYFIQYSVGTAVSWPIRASWRFSPWSSAENDRFVYARILEGNSPVSMAQVLGATPEPGAPLTGFPATSPLLWWRYTSPNDGVVTIENAFGSVTNVVLAVYKGATVDTLSRLAVGTNSLALTLLRGEPCYIAAEVPAGSAGDVGLRISVPRGGNSTRVVPGNLVQNFSFEQVTNEDPTAQWDIPQPAGWVLGAPFTMPAADGVNYLLLGDRPIGQSLATTPGQPYRVRLAVRAFTEERTADVRILFDGAEIGRISFPLTQDQRFWHWRDFQATATGSESRLEIQGTTARVELDSISVVGLADPPKFVNPPADLLGVVGGSVTLLAGVSGSEPLTFLWFHNDQPMNNSRGRLLTLNPVNRDDSGKYRVQVSNPWGQITSDPVTLTVEGDDEIRIVRQPVGEAVYLGQYYVLDVLASGAPTYQYQWYRDGQPLDGITGRQLIFESVRAEDLGTYYVLVRGSGKSVTSLPAPLTASAGVTGGGMIRFASWQTSPVDFLVRVTDLDGATPLSGDSYAVQLYAGRTSETLRPVGVPQPFLSGNLAGRWGPQTIRLPQVAPGETFHAQVRVWDRSAGASYEEARALGGRFGRSIPTTAIAGEPLVPPSAIETFQSFSLEPGQPGFTVGHIASLRVEADGGAVWKLTGAPGFKYLLERQTDGSNWTPVEVINNFQGAYEFSTPASTEVLVLYRARMLD